jgi:hypothetical protein
VKRVLLTTVLLATAIFLAGCGSSKESSSTPSSTPATSASDNAIYEHSFSECASASLKDLAGKYHVANTTPNNVAHAVGAAWSDRFQGGSRGTAIGASGCHDGLAQRPDSNTAA